MSDTVVAKPQRPAVGLSTKLIYGLGSVAYGVKDQGLSSLLLLFYNQVLGMPASLVAAALGLALALDAIIDPLIGQASDMTRTRIGRRHPFLYASMIPVALSFLLLWNPPSGLTQSSLIVWLVGCILVVRTFITVFEIPSAAMISEFTPDYDQRTSLLSFRYFFGWIGGTAMTIMAYQVFLVPDANQPVGLLNREGYSKYALMAAIVMFLSILISAVGTHRWIPWLPQAKANDRKSAWATLQEMLATLKNRAFATILMAGLFTSMASGLVGALGVYFGTYFWRLTGPQLSGLVVSSMLATVTALALAPIVSTRMGKKKGVTVLALIAISFSIGPMILKSVGLMPPLGSSALLLVLSVTTYVTVTATIIASILNSSMIADVVEDSEVRTGRRSEGLFFSAASLVQKSVSGFGIVLSGLVLQLSQFPTKADPATLDPTVMDRLVWMYVPMVTGLILTSLLALHFYRIDRDTHEANLRALAEIQAAGGSESEPDGPRLGN